MLAAMTASFRFAADSAICTTLGHSAPAILSNHSTRQATGPYPRRFCNFNALAVALSLLLGCSACEDNGEDDEVVFSTPQTECAPAAEQRLRMGQLSVDLADDEQELIADAIARRISDGYQTAQRLAQTPPPCTDVAADGYLQALYLLGQDQRCIDYVDACLKTDLPSATDVPDAIAPRLAYLGAQCADRHDQYERAYELYDLATSDVTCHDLGGRVFGFARFAAGTQYDEELATIMARNPAWTGAELERAIHAVEFVVTGNSAGDEDAVIEFIERHLTGDDPSLRDQLFASYGRRMRYRDRNAFLHFLRDNFVDAGDKIGRDGAFALLLPLAEVAYSALYGAGEGGLSRARRVYNAYLPFVSKSRWLPREENTYTYSELYQDICRDDLSQGPGFEAYTALSQRWRTGELSAAEALTAGRDHVANFGETADVLTFIGDMEQLRGQEDAAVTAYLRAHELCPYYNRAHFGLIEVQINRGYRHLRDHDAVVDDMRKRVAALPYGDSLRQYVLNYDALGEEGIRRLQYSLAFWAPYIDWLIAAEQRFYVKEGFELLSHAPELAFVRDTRVDYPGDYRLLDDIRGTGGSPVVTSRGEIERAVLGGYNTALHEVSHQIHLNGPESLKTCITRLYEAAAARDIFTDPYAAINDIEYFAQAVSFYAVPADAPLRYGLNRGHLLAIDPDLDALIAAIEAAGAGTDAPDLDAIACPLAE